MLSPWAFPKMTFVCPQPTTVAILEGSCHRRLRGITLLGLPLLRCSMHCRQLSLGVCQLAPELIPLPGQLARVTLGALQLLRGAAASAVPGGPQLLCLVGCLRCSRPLLCRPLLCRPLLCRLLLCRPQLPVQHPAQSSRQRMQSLFRFSRVAPQPVSTGCVIMVASISTASCVIMSDFANVTTIEHWAKPTGPYIFKVGPDNEIFSPSILRGADSAIAVPETQDNTLEMMIRRPTLGKCNPL